MIPPRRLKGWRRIPPTTITAGGTIVGASLSPKASPKQATGLWKKNRVSAGSFATHMATTCGFAFTRSTGPPNRSSVATAGSAPTTLAQGKRSASAGRPLPKRAWITSHRISTKNSAPYSNPLGRSQQPFNFQFRPFQAKHSAAGCFLPPPSSDSIATNRLFPRVALARRASTLARTRITAFVKETHEPGRQYRDAIVSSGNLNNYDSQAPGCPAGTRRTCDAWRPACGSLRLAAPQRKSGSHRLSEGRERLYRRRSEAHGTVPGEALPGNAGTHFANGSFRSLSAARLSLSHENVRRQAIPAARSGTR